MAYLTKSYIVVFSRCFPVIIRQLFLFFRKGTQKEHKNVEKSHLDARKNTVKTAIYRIKALK